MKKRETREIIRMVVTLFAISLICSAILGVVNAVTVDKIAEIEAETRASAMREVLPEAETFADVSASLTADFKAENAVTGIYAAAAADGSASGYAVMVAPRGFGGEIVMIVGVNTEGAVSGVVITEMSETPGLGVKANDPAFLSQYAGKSGSLSVVKGAAGDNQISAITGATVTSRAVTAGVLAAMKAAAAAA